MCKERERLLGFYFKFGSMLEPLYSYDTNSAKMARMPFSVFTSMDAR